MSSRTLRALALATAALVTSAALAACGGDEPEKSAAEAAAGNAPEAPALKLGYFPNITHAPALVGVNKKLFDEKLGSTKLETTTFNAGPAAIEALLSGAIDATYIGPNPAINGWSKSKGEALKIVAGSTSGGAGLVVKEGINNPADLKGKKIATPQLGNTQDVAFLNWVAEQGWRVDPQSGRGDVSVVRTDNKTIPNAYKSGSVDGAWVPEPTASKLVAEGGKVLLDEATLWPGKKFVITNIVVRQSFLKKHPRAVEAVLKASVESNKWINADPDAAKAAANRQLAADSGKALPADVLDPAWSSIRFTDDPLAATLHTEAVHAVTAGLLTKPDLRGIYDLTLLNKVLSAMGARTVGDAGLGTR